MNNLFQFEASMIFYFFYTQLTYNSKCGFKVANVSIASCDTCCIGQMLFKVTITHWTGCNPIFTNQPSNHYSESCSRKRSKHQNDLFFLFVAKALNRIWYRVRTTGNMIDCSLCVVSSYCSVLSRCDIVLVGWNPHTPLKPFLSITHFPQASS